MSKERVIESTEKSWIKAIAEDAGVAEREVAMAMLKFGVKAQTTPPRAKSLRFDSIEIKGIRAESERDGPFELSWDGLGTGIWAVMSERNLRGKSSLLNLLQASIRGEFPGKVKKDVWKWLESVVVTYSIDNVLHRTEIHKAAGEEDAARGQATLSRYAGDGAWTTLYAGDGGEGLKSQTETLMMKELDFPIIYAHNKTTGGHPHGWPLIASTLFLSSMTEGKALFGDLHIDGIPLRLLQLFIGLPWVSTYSAALTAQKQMEQSQVTRPNQSGMSAILTERLLGVEAELEAAKKIGTARNGRAAKRLELAQLDNQAAIDRKDAIDAKNALETITSTVVSVSTSYDEARRRLKQLEDEQSAGYSFRKLSPSCCPACEAAFDTAKAVAVPVPVGTCGLCKNDLPLEADNLDSDRIEQARQLVEELSTSLQIAKATFKASEKAAGAAASRWKDGQEQIAMVQASIDSLPADAELIVIQLEAQAKQLREMVSALAAPLDEGDDDAKELKILGAAVEVSKTLMTTMQTDLLTEISGSVMALAKKFGVSNVTSMQLDNGGKLKVHQGGADIYFTHLTMGERLRIKIAISLAAVEVAKKRGYGRHPGLLVIDSPASEEVVNKDFEQMLDSVSTAAKDIGDVQIIIGTIARPAVDAVVHREHRLHAKGDDYLF